LKDATNPGESTHVSGVKSPDFEAAGFDAFVGPKL
jgi:hypothetical protein